MKHGKLVMALLLFGVLSTTVLPDAKGDIWNKQTTFTFSGPVEVPGKVLPAGTYVFRLADNNGDRHIVQIWDKDNMHLITTVLAIPDYRMRVRGKTVITFKETPNPTMNAATGEPEVGPPPIKEWFYPGDNFGQEFVYPHERAVQISRTNNETVMSTESSNMNTAAVTPVEPQEQTEVAEAQPAPPPPAPPQTQDMNPEPQPAPVNPAPTPLPKTASLMPLVGLIGLVSLGAALSLRVFAKLSA
jgi:hypothetical protein